MCDDGLVIDLGPIKRIAIDPTGRRVTVGAGVRWGELDAATQAFGLATTGGTMSRTGVSGLTLGGGIGWLMRRHGLTVDNLLSAEMVTADGTTLTASDDEEPELFWGIRGGGPGLGVVTALTYQLHPVGPDVVAGLVLWRLEDGPDVLRAYRDFIASAPPDVATAVALRRAPPAPFLPVELHRRPVCAIVLAAFGAHDRGEQLLAPMRSFGRPLLDLINVRPYTDLQSMFDNANPDGWHYYWKSAGLHHLDDGTIDTLVDHAHDARSPWSYSVLFHLGGAVAAVDPEATAYSRRDVAHQLNVNAVWQRHEPFAATEPAWARNLVAALSPRHAGVVPQLPRPRRPAPRRRSLHPHRLCQADAAPATARPRQPADGADTHAQRPGVVAAALIRVDRGRGGWCVSADEDSVVSDEHLPRRADHEAVFILRQRRGGLALEPLASLAGNVERLLVELTDAVPG